MKSTRRSSSSSISAVEDKLTINIRLDKETVRAGSLVSGELLVHATKRIKADHFEVYLEGKEFTTIECNTEIKQGERLRRSHKEAHSCHRLLTNRATVFDEEGVFEEGKIP